MFSHFKTILDLEKKRKIMTRYHYFDILSHAESSMLKKILASKQLMYIAPATRVVGIFLYQFQVRP